MIDEREIVRRAAEGLTPPEPSFDRLLRRRDRVQRNRRIREGVLALAIVIAVGWLGVHEIRSTLTVPADRSEQLGIFAPVAGRIVYVNEAEVGDRRYGTGLWAVDPSGPSDTAAGRNVAEDVASTLVPLRVEDAEPIGWSSDGTELLLMRSVGDSLLPEQYLSILHADGSETRLSKEPMGVSAAAISPDGTRVVFAGQYNLSGLYAIDVEGGQPVQLPIPQAGEGASSPSFSPDGTKIAYLAGNRNLQVWVANADGTDAHEILTDEPTVFRGVSGLEWSPTGEHLAIGFGGYEGSDGIAIYTFAPDGSDFTKVITGGTSPHWSPDGSRSRTRSCAKNSQPPRARKDRSSAHSTAPSPPVSAREQQAWRSPMRTAPTSESSATRSRVHGTRPRVHRDPGEGNDEDLTRTCARAGRHARRGSLHIEPRDGGRSFDVDGAERHGRRFGGAEHDGLRAALMVAAERSPGSPPEDLAELHEVLRSIQIEQ